MHFTGYPDQAVSLLISPFPDAHQQAAMSNSNPAPRRRLSRPPLIHHTTSFTDHANRPAYTFWSGTDDDLTPPSFSFQVYTTADVALTTRWPKELFSDDGGSWRVDVYEQQPDVWACVEHQRRERQWRNEHPSEGPGKIVERYAEEAAMGGFIIVIDRERWYWQHEGDDGGLEGPLGVWFDVREGERRGILDGGIDGDGMVFEQAEMRVQRMATATNPNHELRIVWMRAGMWDWEDVAASRARQEAEREPETESQPPSVQLVEVQVTASETPSGGIILQTDIPDGDVPTLIYTLYPLFTTTTPLTPAERTSIARRFVAHLATHLPSSSVQLEATPQMSSLTECIAYAATSDTSVGYLTPSGRRFPEYGFGAGTVRMREHENGYARFLVVLDREQWEEEGVCFVWAEPRGEGAEILVGRVGGGMSGVAERLGGLR